MDDTFARHRAMLRTALGPDIQKLIDDDDITEVYVNSDYVVRVDSMHGRYATNIVLTPDKVRRICEIVAGMNDQIINQDHPMLGVEISLLKIRAQLLYPPCSPCPTFFFRKKPRKIFSLEEYVANGTLSPFYYDKICSFIKERKNLVVCGATGSGKTTFINAILKKLAEVNPDHRLAILEDLPELQSSSRDVQYLVTSGNRASKVTMQDLVYVSMRLSPTRIIIGETRNRECYDLLKAWNTGHPGGFTTVHADSTSDCLTRLELLAKEAFPEGGSGVTLDMQRLIGSTVDVIVSIQKKLVDGRERRLVDDMITLHGFDLSTHQYLIQHEKPDGSLSGNERKDVS